MVGSISELYTDYKKRLMEVDSMEQDLLSVTDKSAWIERLRKKSEIIRAYYRVTEDELGTFIRPILEGKEELDAEAAGQFYLGAYDYFMNVMSDEMLESQIFIKLWDYFHQQGNEYYERACKSAFSSSPFLNVEGELQRLGMEQADWVSGFVVQIEHLQKLHQSDGEFERDVQRIMKTIEREYEMESEKFEPNVNRLIACFNKMSRIRKYRGSFSDEVWAGLQDMLARTGKDVLFMASLFWDQLEEGKQQEIGPALPLGFLEELPKPMEQRNLQPFVGYAVYAFRTGQLSAEETYALLRGYWKSVKKELDFTKPEWREQTENSRFYLIRHAARPMLQMIEAFSCGAAKKQQYKAELLYEIKMYIETIPRECACKDYLDQALYHLLYDLIPYIDDESVALELIDGMTISRQLATLIHTVMTARLCELVLEPMLEKHPELFCEALGVTDPQEVLRRKNELHHLLYYAARVHDIGKILIANIINTQIRRLTDMEYSYIRLHSKWSYEILNRNPKLSAYAEIALGHHKSYDGSMGYPASFDNTKSRYRILIDILTLCDCLDAGTDKLGRNYVPGKGFREMLAEFEQEKGKRYRPELVELLQNDRQLAETLAEVTSEEARTELYYKIYRQYR
ncbi:MAG: HD domain-containing phosphohydrolase [Lachnospiraceae bacterium]|nr:HD domain-containing phosphohydrolase [Lachnospiraceae bacterium]